MANELKDTLQLPKTDFPMRAGLAQREPSRVEHWAKIGLYDSIQSKRSKQKAPVFVLHDGPPFTNGDVHIGTALNKTLKDIILRYKSMRGFRTPYVPGWDCHGLPIEQKVTREFQQKKIEVTTAKLREHCDQFSEGWIATQTKQFKRLGVLADWSNEYKTKAPAYEADILRTFASFVERKLVYRSKKPVYWSIPFETALAEAEIEYKDHISPSIWVKFPIPEVEAKKFNLPTDKPLSLVIWTTTPWTIPANLAIALNPELSYSVVSPSLGKPENWIIATERISALEPLIDGQTPESKRGPLVRGTEVLGKTLEGLKARHPIIERDSMVVLADYVTTESGSGAVHTAPGHGMDDYLTGLRYGLEIYCPVGDNGCFIDDGKVPQDLVGISCVETVEDLEKKKTSQANIAVLRKLDQAEALVAKQRYTHSYPHCWRSKTPIIFRAVDQWFVSLDKENSVFEKNTPRAQALDSIEGVQWIPAWGKARIRGAVESRPDWCISRQRSWGVPIPAFYDEKKKAFLDADVIRSIADKIEKVGSNLWYATPAEAILAGVTLPKDWPAASSLNCGRDTLDVWIDSGSSHAAVLAKQQGGTQWPADLYLEGSDQHRGWFQSSLWTSIISRNKAPYKAVLTHGFITDEERKKISKSSTYEKPQTSDAYIAEHGADVIRLWIASQDFRDDIPISKEILSHVGETYRLLRNTLRFQLANLFDFNPAKDTLPTQKLDTIDRWALHHTAELIRQCTEAYDAYEFHRVYQLCNQFCVVTLSATYHDILKDRLYTMGTNSALRRSSQTVLHHIFQTLIRLLAPVIPFTTDEAWAFATTGKEFSEDSIHQQDWPVVPADWKNQDLEIDMLALLKVRTEVNGKIEPMRAAGKLGKALDASLTIKTSASDPAHKALYKHHALLAELFIVSKVDLASKPEGSTEVGAVIEPQHSQELGFIRCPRCWRWLPKLETTAHGDICPRCSEALAS